ncbi:hypothetical protein KGD83_11625 [Nocardiopsis akebiae]|uniref:Uncharacterized protein n=1 Tax=Nocardiopsis akebiae TaxID=2831968 RepID=A0ABX8CB40_9ACTN|nr:hypothetical protein [Nocardiopsis akebiae]QUX31075.1 hypothetical protein KGD83_11625 [Nocardiopsis akebiae]
MSVVVLLGAGALVGLVALTAIVVVTLLREGAQTTGEEAAAEAGEPGTAAGRVPEQSAPEDADRSGRVATADGSVV